MTQKWELLKDYPDAKAGTIFYAEEGASIPAGLNRYIWPDEHPEFFRRVPNRWEPKEGEQYWHLGFYGAVNHSVFDGGCLVSRLAFRTKSLALAAKERMESALETYHEEIGE